MIQPGRHQRSATPASLDHPAVVLEDGVRIPAVAHSLADFRRWTHSDRFPQEGRIDYLAGDVEVEMSPEDLFTHGAVKSAIAAELHRLIADADRGYLFVDRARVTAPAAGLSVEPDVVALLHETVAAGRARLVPGKAGKPGRFIEIEGAPDLVVEVVSDASVAKDTARLPPLYAAAGVTELWLVDARGETLDFRVHRLESGGYARLEPDADGWIASPALGRRVRLRRRPAPLGTWGYRLEVGSAPR
jgi:Uma2 family endonuclease